MVNELHYSSSMKNMKIQIRGLDKWGTVNRKTKIYMSFWGHLRNLEITKTCYPRSARAAKKTTRSGKILSRILKWYPLRTEKITYL